LRAVARTREQIREFFAARDVLEVDVPLLQGGGNLDRGVEPALVSLPDGPRWLITSPEHPLKRLLAAGAGDCWSLSPCVRAGELGARHAPEFRMLEWYRTGFDHHRLAAECVALAARCCEDTEDYDTLSYREAFQTHAGCDPLRADDAELAAALGEERAATCAGDRAAMLDLLLAEQVQPALGRTRWCVLIDWPAEQAAQARHVTDAHGAEVAARFELYRDGLELANGYWELRDAEELAGRLSHEQAQRADAPTRDQRFESAMRAGLPDCAGVALGFDRLLMLALGKQHIDEVQAFGWERA